MMTEDVAMTEDRFIELISAYGVDPLRWPEAERRAAHDLMASDSVRIRTALSEAQELDDYLSLATVPPVSDALRSRLHKSARPSLANRLRGFLGWDGALWQPAAALTAALVLGIGLGVASPQEAIALTNISVESPVTNSADSLLEEDDTL